MGLVDSGFTLREPVVLHTHPPEQVAVSRVVPQRVGGGVDVEGAQLSRIPRERVACGPTSWMSSRCVSTSCAGVRRSRTEWGSQTRRACPSMTPG